MHHHKLCKEKPQPASEGLPCQLCIELEAYNLRIAELEAEFKRVVKPARDVLKQIRKAAAELRHNHPKCMDCGILFGGQHLEGNTPQGVCFSCLKRRLRKTNSA